MALLLLFCASAGAQQASLEGIAVNQATGEPLSGVHVTLYTLSVEGTVLAAQAPSGDKPARLESTVTNSLTGEPVLRAHIALRSSGPTPYGALTTAEGKFSIAGLAPGTYQLSVDKSTFFAPPEPGGRTTVEVVLRSGEKKVWWMRKANPWSGFR